jgi:hypothetical protein
MRFLLIILILFSIISPAVVIGADNDEQPIESANKKVYLLNGALATTMLAWGYINWDYGEKSAHMESEGWFEHDTEEGGADKLGHMYAGYAITHGSAALYRKWGYSREKASLYGAGTSLMITGLIEVGDSFSNYGFSYEDMIANTLGATLGYYLYRYPEVQKKIDFRWEFNPDFDEMKSDFVTDYEHSKYLFAIKAEGFDSIQNNWLKALELHIGYYTRNYEDYDPTGPDNRKRYIYAGIGLNVTRLIRSFSRTRIFDYLQVPHTYVEMRNEIEP